MNQKESTKNTNSTKGEKTMVKIDYAKVNKLASAIYQAWIANHPEDRNRDTYNLAMREAWKEMKVASFHLENLEDFCKLKDEDKMLVLRQKATLVPLLVMREKHIVNGEAVYHGISRIAWMLRKKDGGKALESWNDSIDMIVNEMYIDVMTKWNKYMESGRENKSFNDFLLCCAKNSAFRIGRQLEDKPSRQSINNPSLDNEDFAHDITFNSKYYYPSPEENAIAEIIMDSICKDEKDKRIQKGKVYGLTQKEIGKYVEMSQVAVSKRISTMKDKYSMMNAEVLADEVNNTIFRASESEYIKRKAVKTKRTEIEADGRYYQYKDMRFVHTVPFISEEEEK